MRCVAGAAGRRLGSSSTRRRPMPSCRRSAMGDDSNRLPRSVASSARPHWSSAPSCWSLRLAAAQFGYGTNIRAPDSAPEHGASAYAAQTPASADKPARVAPHVPHAPVASAAAVAPVAPRSAPHASAPPAPDASTFAAKDAASVDTVDAPIALHAPASWFRPHGVPLFPKACRLRRAEHRHERRCRRWRRRVRRR